MTDIPRPDVSERPLSLTCEAVIHAAPADVFAAWTTRFDAWFAEPGALFLRPEPGAAYFFYNRTDWGRHPHYGRILALEENTLVEMTWMTGNGTDVGTAGAETILRIDLAPTENGTHVRLTHSGFVSEPSRDGHAENWPLALDILNQAIGA